MKNTDTEASGDQRCQYCGGKLKWGKVKSKVGDAYDLVCRPCESRQHNMMREVFGKCPVREFAPNAELSGKESRSRKGMRTAQCGER